MLALMLPVLLGFAALAVDVSYFWVVRSELQNAADAASLAAVRDLNGTPAKLPLARVSAFNYGRLHLADARPVVLDLNVGNDPTGDIVLGNWSFTSRTFTPAGALMPAYAINAVSVRTERSAADGSAVATFLGRVFGRTAVDVVTSAVAVGGSPNTACAAPLAVAECSILQPDGSLRCNADLTFGQATTDTVGFTLFSSQNPTTPAVTCMFARMLGRPCPANCDCSTSCNSTGTATGEIKISNGNNLSQTTVDDINAAVDAARANGGLFLQVPVVDSGGYGAGTCGGFNYNQDRGVLGFVTIELTGASFSPNKAIYSKVNCDRSGYEPPGGAFFGYTSLNVYLAR